MNEAAQGPDRQKEMVAHKLLPPNLERSRDGSCLSICETLTRLETVKDQLGL